MQEAAAVVRARTGPCFVRGRHLFMPCCVGKQSRRWPCWGHSRTLMFRWCAVFFFCTMVAVGVGGTKLADHSCYTGLDPETATKMDCNNKYLTGAFYPYIFVYNTGITHDNVDFLISRRQGRSRRSWGISWA